VSSRVICMFIAALALAAPAADTVSAQAPAAQGARQGGRSGTAAPAPAGRSGAARGATAATPQRSPGAGPKVVVLETVKGTIEFETYPNEAPKTVEHILALVRRNFYNGLRIHRVEPGFVVQFGDPQTRDMTKHDLWGTGGSGRPVGVSEFSPKRLHKTGAVALAHPGDARQGDSQMYFTLSPQPRLDSLRFTVFGQVISGMDVVRKLQVNDVIRKATVRDATATAAAPRPQ
jgi:cyclophilin family peptidyl-prolyl cis-trans isomerase